MHPPHRPKRNESGRKIALNFGEDLFFFFGDHLILGEKNVWISDFGRKISLNFGEDLFFFFFFFFFGDHLISGEKNVWISDFGRKISLNFGEDIRIFVVLASNPPQPKFSGSATEWCRYITVMPMHFVMIKRLRPQLTKFLSKYTTLYKIISTYATLICTIFLFMMIKTSMRKMSEVEPRTQGSRARPRTQKKIRGQGQERSRPRTKDTNASTCFPKKKGLEGGESSSQFRWFTIAKIELYFLFWFWGCVCKDIQQIQKDIPPKKVLGNSEFCSSRQNHSSLND